MSTEKYIPPRSELLEIIEIQEKRNSELTAELEDLRQFKKEVDGEGVVPATRVLDKERQVSELTARIAELTKERDDERFVNEDYRKSVANLEAALAEARKDSAWQPIETAPKDGTHIIFHEPDGFTCVGFHNNKRWLTLPGLQLAEPKFWRVLFPTMPPATPLPETEETI